MNDNLLTSIYASAVDTGLWTEAIDQCVHHVGSTSGVIISVETDGSLFYNLNVLSDFFRDESKQDDIRRWLTEFSEYDADGVVRSAAWPVFSPCTDLELWPEPGLETRPDILFLKEQFGLHRRLAARLSDNPRFVQAIAFQYETGVDTVPQSHVSLVESVCPHVAKSLEMGLIFRQLKSRYDAVLAALDKVEIGICILQPDGAVVSKNSEAERIFSESSLISLKNHRTIKLPSSELDALLSSYVKASSLGRSTEAVAEQMITVKDKTGERSIIVEVSPLRDHYQEIDSNSDFVFLQIIDTDSNQRCSIERFASVYRLTRAESSITSLATDGLNSREIADVRGTTVDTVRGQLKSIMRKANVNNRIELIRQIIKTDPPIKSL
jgi:DNA-binding NarL/FixJ family response regulator